MKRFPRLLLYFNIPAIAYLILWQLQVSGTLLGLLLFGLVSLSHQIGSALGSYAGGKVHDLTGSYAGFFAAGVLLSAAAAVMAWAISEARAVGGLMTAASGQSVRER